jgi:hypothetical protein
MAVAGVSRPNFEALSRILAEVGKSIDVGSHEGVKVSDSEAQKILEQVGKLGPGDRKLIEAELQQLLVNDVFSASPEARQRFATHFGVEVRELDPALKRELVGLTSSRSAFQMGVETMAKSPRLDRKTMKLLISRADTLLDQPSKQFLAATLRNGSRDGLITMDTDARKEFRKWMGDLDQAGTVSDWGQIFDAKGSGKSSYLSQLMASGMCFEDILAAFMVHIAGKMQKEQVEKLKEIEEAEKLEQAKANGKAPAGAQPDLKALMAAADIDSAADLGGPTHAAAPAAEAMDPGLVSRTQRHLEALVQSVDHHIKDDGVIDAAEAGKIAEKLGRLEPPVSELIAKSLVDTLRRTPGVYLESETFKPIVQWAKGELGPDIDVTAIRGEGPSDPTNPLAAQMRSDDKLENKIASFLVDTLLSDEKEMSSKMADLRQFSAAMMEHPASAKAYEQVSSAPGAPAAALDPSTGAPAAAFYPATAPARAAGVPEAAVGPAKAEPKSRQVLFEELKNLNNELGQMFQAIGNILNSFHQNAMNSIRSIR